VNSREVLPNNPEALIRIILDSEALLLDFDGPICSVFSDLPATLVAGRLKESLRKITKSEIPPSIASSADPFDVLDFASTLGASEATEIESILTKYEVQAVGSARPTLDAIDLIHAWQDKGRKLAIVSNNSHAAVEAYLNRCGLEGSVDLIAARKGLDSNRLKPDPYLISQAISYFDLSPTQCVLVGDSLTDVEAAHAANCKVVGYVNKSEKLESFRSVLTDATVTSIRPIIEAVCQI
jgi:HAD superfamily hydrolase (TIGR01662 family)